MEKIAYMIERSKHETLEGIKSSEVKKEEYLTREFGSTCIHIEMFTLKLRLDRIEKKHPSTLKEQL